VAINKDFRVKNGLVVEEGAVIAGLTYPTTDGSSGHILVTDGSGNLTFQKNPISEITGEPMGFVNRTDSTISFNDSTRTFTIAPASTSYEVWTKGTKRTVSSSLTVTIPNTSGLYYIYFDASGDLQQQTSFFNLETQTPVAYVYWNATQSSTSFIADERHGVVMDWRTHEYLHRTRGAAFASGFGASNYVIEGNGSLDSHMQLDLDGGTFYDEDLKIQITHSNTPTDIWEQDLQGPAKIPMFYLDGNAEWKIDTPTDFPLKQGVSRPQYNVNTGGVWSTADIDNLNYGETWILATNNIQYPIIGIIGQYYSDSEGQAESRNFTDLNLTGFPIVEYRPLYKLIYRCSDAYTNTPSARLQSIWDLRTIQQVTLSTYNATDHGNLSGLGDDDHLQYVHISEDRTISADHTFTGDLSLPNTSIGKLKDVDLTTNPPTNGKALIWNSSSSKFVPGESFSLSDFNNAIANTSINALSDVNTSSTPPSNGQALIWNGTNFVPGDVTADFLGLTDSPNSYSGQANRIVKVNNSANGLEFGDLVAGSQSREVFTSDGATTAYTLSNTYGGQNSVLVFVDGVIQYPGANYTLSGSTLTLLGTPALDARIEVFGLTPVTTELTPGDGTVTAKKLAASAYTRDIFTGDGTETTFELTGDVGTELAPFVFVGGILQDPDTAYNINVLANPQTITFTEAIPNATEITVVYGPVNVTGVPSDATITFQKMAPSVFAYDTFTGDGTTTAFTMSQSALSAKHLLVSVASVLQTPETAYTISGNTLTFSSAPANGANITARYFVGGTVGIPADDSVSTIKIQNLAVTTAKIANGAVTTGKIANNAITTNLIADGSITSDKIANGTVIAADILDGTITKAKLNFNPEDDAVALAIALG